MNGVDAVNHWDVPVTGFKPKDATVRVAQRDRLAEPDDDVEVWIVSSERVAVYDFYRHRPSRVEVVRRYG